MSSPGDANDNVFYEDFDVVMASGKRFRVSGDAYINGVPIPSSALPPAAALEYVQLYDGNQSPLATTQDFAYYVPFDVARATAFSNLLVQVTTLAASSVVRAGIYADDGTLRNPGARLVDGGSIASDVTGVKTFTTAITLMPGRYWALIVAQGGAPSLTFVFSTPVRVSLPTGATLSNIGKGVTGLSGALPATATPATNTVGGLPAVMLRAA